MRRIIPLMVAAALAVPLLTPAPAQAWWRGGYGGGYGGFGHGYYGHGYGGYGYRGYGVGAGIAGFALGTVLGAGLAAPYYAPPPVYYAPPPVYYAPPPGYYYRPY